VWLSDLRTLLVSRSAANLHSAPGARWTVEARTQPIGIEHPRRQVLRSEPDAAARMTVYQLQPGQCLIQKGPERMIKPQDFDFHFKPDSHWQWVETIAFPIQCSRSQHQCERLRGDQADVRGLHERHHDYRSYFRPLGGTVVYRQPTTHAVSQNSNGLFLAQWFVDQGNRATEALSTNRAMLK
jgi:hypothetical protein